MEKDIIVKINGFEYLYNKTNSLLYADGSYTTLNHLTENEKKQLFNFIKYPY